MGSAIELVVVGFDFHGVRRRGAVDRIPRRRDHVSVHRALPPPRRREHVGGAVDVTIDCHHDFQRLDDDIGASRRCREYRGAQLTATATSGIQSRGTLPSRTDVRTRLPNDSVPVPTVDASQLTAGAMQPFSAAPSSVNPTVPGTAVARSPAPAQPTAATPVPQPAPTPAAAVAIEPVSVMTRVVRLCCEVSSIRWPSTTRRRAPAETPALWSLFAFARREFETAYSSPSLTVAPGNVQTTGQAVAAEQRTLVLTAFPAEADAILARTTLDSNPTVVVDGRHFYLGSIGGKKVIVAMTDIGMVNAAHTTELRSPTSHPSPASPSAQWFSRASPGDSDAPRSARWRSRPDGPQTTANVACGRCRHARSSQHVDRRPAEHRQHRRPACLYCGPLARLPLIDLMREPQLFVGGDGSSDDNNNGAAFPAIASIPLIGDILDPQPFAAPDFSPLFVGNFFEALGPFLVGGLLSNLTGLLSPVTPPVDAVDQETAAAQQVADAHGIPFLGIRGMSDGPGDSLHLPGYPFTFFVYKQIAADNAAIVTEAFLQSWAGV